MTSRVSVLAAAVFCFRFILVLQVHYLLGNKISRVPSLLVHRLSIRQLGTCTWPTVVVGSTCQVLVPARLDDLASASKLRSNFGLPYLRHPQQHVLYCRRHLVKQKKRRDILSKTITSPLSHTVIVVLSFSVCLFLFFLFEFFLSLCANPPIYWIYYPAFHNLC